MSADKAIERWERRTAAAPYIASLQGFGRLGAAVVWYLFWIILGATWSVGFESRGALSRCWGWHPLAGLMAMIGGILIVRAASQAIFAGTIMRPQKQTHISRLLPMAKHRWNTISVRAVARAVGIPAALGCGMLAFAVLLAHEWDMRVLGGIIEWPGMVLLAFVAPRLLFMQLRAVSRYWSYKPVVRVVGATFILCAVAAGFWIRRMPDDTPPLRGFVLLGALVFAMGTAVWGAARATLWVIDRRRAARGRSARDDARHEIRWEALTAWAWAMLPADDFGRWARGMYRLLGVTIGAGILTAAAAWVLAGWGVDAGWLIGAARGVLVLMPIVGGYACATIWFVRRGVDSTPRLAGLLPVARHHEWWSMLAGGLVFALGSSALAELLARGFVLTAHSLGATEVLTPELHLIPFGVPAIALILWAQVPLLVSSRRVADSSRIDPTWLALLGVLGLLGVCAGMACSADIDPRIWPWLEWPAALLAIAVSRCTCDPNFWPRRLSKTLVTDAYTITALTALFSGLSQAWIVVPIAAAIVGFSG